MDLQLVRKGALDYAKKNKKWVLLLLALGFSSYGAYKVYNLPSIVQKRKGFAKLLGALISVAETISDSAETIGVVAKDFKYFLQSESDQIPNSLKQISKITKSNEFSGSVVSLTQALTVGIMRGCQSGGRINHGVSSNANGNSSFLDKVFDKLSTPAGSGLVSVVVGSFARNLVMAFYQDGQSGGGLTSNSELSNVTTNNSVDMELDSVSRWVNVVCDSKFKELLGDCIQLFVSTAVAVFLDKTLHINPYDEFFAGLTNPNHETEVKDVLVSVCNGAIETLVKTSHQVLTTADSDVKSSSGYPCLTINGEGCVAEDEHSLNGAFSNESKARNSFEEVKDSGWVGKVSSTLAVPSNRRLVLDVTGRVTFETVRSFLEFVLEKLYFGIKKCINVAHGTVVDGSFGVVRYVTAKSSVVATICISLCLHTLDAAWFLVPA